MTVWFIGAGPGDPELLTRKAERLIAACPVCLYAGSLVPPEVVAMAPAGALVMDTAAMTLDETHAVIVAAQARGRGRGAGAFGRPVAVRRDRRADPAAAGRPGSAIRSCPGCRPMRRRRRRWGRN